MMMKLTNQITKNSNRPVKSLFGLFLAGLLFTACDIDFLDPTPVDNPQATEEDFLNSDAPLDAFMPGMEMQFSRAIGAMVLTTEFTSDNASVNGTGVSATFNVPENISGETPSINTTGVLGGYFNLQELKAMGNFVFNEILDHDEDPDPQQVAQAHYYLGMALLMLGENYVAAPLEEDGDPVGSRELIGQAITELEAVEQAGPSTEISNAAIAALARAHRAYGNTDEADSYAELLLEADEEFIFSAQYDSDNLANRPWIYTTSRSLREMQPLPRLDHLDPKYTDDEDPIPVATAEEMHLIRAEVAMSNGNYDEALDHLIDASDLALTVSDDRPRVTFEDSDERLNNDLEPRPRNEEILIAADPDSEFREGLVQTRPGEVEVSKVSWTSIDADSLNNVDTSDELHMHRLLFTLRQEIMFYEGRRLHDLGIRLPMMQREYDNNPNISSGDFGTEIYIPDYIPSSDDMNRFDPFVPYDDEELVTTEVTMRYDMNRVLADPTNRGLLINNPFLDLN